MHDLVNNPGADTACDDSPDRLAARLRYVAHALAYAASGKWLLARIAVLFVFLANLRTRLQHGRTAVVRPSRSGGSDHSARAVLRRRNPMVFGGRWTTGAACTDTPARYRSARGVIERPAYTEVPGHSGATHLVRDGWILTRRVVSACFTLRWPADCSAHEIP